MLGKPIEFEENVVNVLVVENPKMFSVVVADFYKQIENNEEGGFGLSEDSKVLSMQKYFQFFIRIQELPMTPNMQFNLLKKIKSFSIV